MTYSNAYAQPSNLYSRYDARILADLVADDNNRLGDATDVSLIQSALNGNQTILDVLADASGVINAAVGAGNRYAVADLQALSDVDAAFLVRLTCSLAYGMLVLRRGEIREQDLPPEYKAAVEELDRIRQGAEVFNILSAKQAGLAEGMFPSAQQYNSLNLYRDYASPSYLPPRRRQQTL